MFRSVCALLVAGVLASVASATSFRCFYGAPQNTVPCTVFLVPDDSESSLLDVASEGERRTFPVGRYSLRAGAGGLALARHSALIVESKDPAVNAAEVALELVPGGVVRVTPEGVSVAGAVELLSLSTGRIDVAFLSRERSLPFPAGSLIAVGVKGPGEVVGITRPWSLEPGHVEQLPQFHQPKRGSGDALISLELPPIGQNHQDAEPSVTLFREGRSFTPELVKRSNDVLYAPFYDIPAGTYELRLVSPTAFLRPHSFTVQESSVALVEGLIAAPKPTLSIDVTGLDRGQTWSAVLLGCPPKHFEAGRTGWPAISECELAAQTGDVAKESTALDRLDPDQYFLIVTAGNHKDGRRLDLRSGQSRHEIVAFQRVHLSGRVRRGPEYIAAEVAFKNGNSDLLDANVTTDATGSYSVLLSSLGEFRVEVQSLDRMDEPPFPIQLTVSDLDSRRDLYIPIARLRASVRDAQTGQPIRDAVVGLILAERGEEFHTDGSGDVELPPPPGGVLRAGVTALGYKPDQLTFPFEEDVREVQLVRIDLKPLLDDNSFRVVLANGTPARNAMVFPDASGAGIACDSSGVCRLAERPADLTLIYCFDPQAGLTPAISNAVLEAGTLILREPQAPLSLDVQRGPATRSSVVLAVVILDGVALPRPVLASVAGRLGHMAVPYLFPNQQNAIMFFGLPQGNVAVALMRGDRHGSALAFDPAPLVTITSFTTSTNPVFLP